MLLESQGSMKTTTFAPLDSNLSQFNSI